MNLKSFLTKFFLGQVVLEKINSPINGEIAVVEDVFGKRFVLAGGLTQSGGLVEKLWNSALKEIHNSSLVIHNSLILGLGCGTVAKLITSHWPLVTKVVGIEIDPEMVRIGKKYFGLDKIPNLEIVIDDAFKFVKNSDPPLVTNHRSLITKYDLIIVDLYLGKEFPKEAEGDEFLNGLKNILTKDGVVIFNRLYYNRELQKNADEFLKKLRSIFPSVEARKAITNLLIFASNKA